MEVIQPKKLLNENCDVEDITILKEAHEGQQTPSLYITGPFIGAEKKNRNGRIYPLHIIEREVKKYQDLIKTCQSVGELNHPECFSTPYFDILTENGWKPFLDITLNDKVWTRNNETGKAELNKVDNIINQEYEGDTYKVSGKNFYGEFTEKHRFLIENRKGIQEYVTIKDIFDNRTKYSHYSIPKTINIDYQKQDENFVIPGINAIKLGAINYTNKENPENDLIISKSLFCKILGLWLAEGSSYPYYTKDGLKRNTKISVTQSLTSNKEKCKLIDDLWNEIPENIAKSTYIYNDKKVWNINDLRIGMYFEQLGNVYTKHLPNEVFSFEKEYLEEIIYWFAIGDGRKSNHNKKYNNKILDNILNVFSVSKQLIEDLSYITLLCGLNTSINVHITNKEYVFADHVIKPENKKPLYILSINTNNKISLDPRNLKIEKIENNIAGSYCISVKNTNFYARMNGKSYWTGNCSEINPERAAILITELTMNGNYGMGKARVCTHTPMGQLLQGLILDGIKMGVSTRGTGNLTNESIVCDDYNLITIDAVYMPSCPDAYVDAVNESAKWVLDEKSGLLIEKKISIDQAKAEFDKKLANKGNAETSKIVAEALKQYIFELKKL